MSKPLILVVEDDVPVRNLITITLKTHGYRYLTAGTGDGAVIETSSHNPDVVLLDLGLPDMDGVDVIRKIRTWSNLPIIVISARSEDPDKIDALDAGADDYLTKPFEISTLYTAIYNQLKNRERIKKKYISSKTAPTPEESTFSAADEKFLNTMNQIITENIDEPNMGVPFLCDKLGMSRASLYNKLKALTGMGANDYINKLRIDNAINLLLNSSLTVNEIADRVGFSTPRYFSAVFKKNMGCSPTQYKEEQFKNNVQNI